MAVRESELRRLERLEGEYRRILVAALKECVRGRWGLLDDLYDDDKAMARSLPAAVGDLLDQGGDIASLRARCGMPPFGLHERLLDTRAQRGENTPGEPKRAAAWLLELDDEG